MRPAAFIYEEALYQHIVQEGHIFRLSRLQYTFELLDCYGAFNLANSRIFPSAPAEEAASFSFHEVGR